MMIPVVADYAIAVETTVCARAKRVKYFFYPTVFKAYLFVCKDSFDDLGIHVSSLFKVKSPDFRVASFLVFFACFNYCVYQAISASE